MLEEPYLSPEGYHVDVLEVFDDRKEGYATLVVQSNEDRDMHRCQIYSSSNFLAGDPPIILDRNLWIYSMWRSPKGWLYYIHSGGILERGNADGFEILVNSDAAFTRIFGLSESEIYIVGQKGYIALFDGVNLIDISIKESNDIYCVSIAEDGTVYASGELGGVFRRTGSDWKQIALPIGVEVNFILALDTTSAYLCGSSGFCGMLRGEELVIYETSDDRSYFAIARFAGDVYFGAGFHGVERLEDGVVVNFKDIAYSYYLDASTKYLYTSGLNRVGRFDGSGWLKQDFL